MPSAPKIEKIAHYKIIKELGGGAMGDVYLAQNLKKDRRKCALKVMKKSLTKDENALLRFKQEALAESKIIHQNIVTIYDWGKWKGIHYIESEYVEGVTLSQFIASRNRLEIKEVLDIAIQILRALVEAHKNGVWHRDIKPDNIMLKESSDGRLVKILDFGIAKLTGQIFYHDSQYDTADTVEQPYTVENTFLGTRGYASPEQTRGEKMEDGKSDIFAVGAVIYEMVTGHNPFEGKNDGEIFSNVLTKDPLPLTHYVLDAPVRLEELVKVALDKQKDNRFIDALTMLNELKSVEAELTGEEIYQERRDFHKRKFFDKIKSPSRIFSSVAIFLVLVAAAVAATIYFFGKNDVPRVDSLAVLPFSSPGGGQTLEVISDGIPESLVDSLLKVPDFKVISWYSSSRYEGREELQVVGRELAVKAILTGEVVQNGEDFEVNVRLTNVADGLPMWQASYHRKFADVFLVQEEIAKDLSQQLGFQVSSDRRVSDNTEANLLYLEGRRSWNKRTKEGFKGGIKAFEDAIALDPSYARAYAGLADSYNLLGRYGFVEPKDAFRQAKEKATRALFLDNRLGEAHTSLAYASFSHDHNWAFAEKEFKTGIDLSPNYATAHHWYALFLAALGRLDEAMEEMRRAQELDPSLPIIKSNLGRLFYYNREFDKAIEQYQEVIKWNPDFAEAHLRLGQVYCQKEMYEEAIGEFQKAIKLSEDTTSMGMLGFVYAHHGKKKEAEKILQDLHKLSQERYVSAYDIALVHIGMEEKEKALDWLERAYERRYSLLVYMNVDPQLDGLRSEKRFQNLISKLEFPK